MEVPYFLKLDGERLLFNQEGELVYYIPQTYFDRNYCFVEGQYVTLLGIFNYAIFDAKGNHKGLKQFHLPSTFICKPGKIEKIKKVKLTATTEEDDYTVLHFAKGDEAITSIKIPEDIENVENGWKIFLRGKFPTTIPDKDLYHIFDEAAKLNGFSYKMNPQMFGLLFSEMLRSSKDKAIPHRLDKSKNPTDYSYLAITDIPKYISPYQSITSQNWDEGLVGAVINDNPKSSPMERLLTEQYGAK
jgi:hypothetical protein